jgi:hypothetical protein
MKGMPKEIKNLSISKLVNKIDTMTTHKKTHIRYNIKKG